jgi:hypothetical protein
MIYRLYKLYKTGKTLYTRVLKPVYEELRKDAYANDTDKRTLNRKKKGNKNAVNQKPKRSNKRKANPKGL